MKTADIYKKYNLMPQLITHQLRVAGIAKLISQDFQDQEESQLGVRACLLHDMGNMAKFTGLTDPYWQKEQVKFWEVWGHDAHVATHKIIEELNLPKINDVMDEEGTFYHNFQPSYNFGDTSKPALLVLYGDLRVAMPGVVSLEERIHDLDIRYPDYPRPEKVWGKKLEEHMQSLTTRQVATIREEDVAPLFDELLNIEWMGV